MSLFFSMRVRKLKAREENDESTEVFFKQMGSDCDGSSLYAAVGERISMYKNRI